MRTQVIDFTGTNIYVGLDVHKKSWSVTVLTDELELKKFTQPPEPSKLVHYLKTNYPGARYYSAYEAGFSGFGHHRELLAEGVQNIVVAPADVPNTSKERTTKTDRIDSRKIARALRSNMLEGIHVFDRAHEEFRSLSRLRERTERNLRSAKQRIKSFLYYYGVHIPDETMSKSWSKAFDQWLAQVPMSSPEGAHTLACLLEDYQYWKGRVKDLTRELRRSAMNKYVTEYKLLTSIPGIGVVTAVTFLAEIGDVGRFASLRKLCSYVGLMPMAHSSGERQRTGHITKRCNSYLRSMLIEASWMAVRKDPALLAYYKQHYSPDKKNKAIVKVARKLLGRIKYVLDNKKPYEIGTTD